MTAFLALLFRLVLLYLVVKLLWSVFAGRKNTFAQDKRKAKPAPPRFDTKGKNVDDGDYEEVK